MNHKKIITILLLLSCIGLVASIFLGLSERTGICLKNDWDCIDKVETIAEPLFFLSIPLIFILFILFFTPTSFFRAWRWFALAFGLISIALIIHAPAQGGGIMSIDKEIISLTMGMLFFIISLFIIFFQTFVYFQKKKRDK